MARYARRVPPRYAVVLLVIVGVIGWTMPVFFAAGVWSRGPAGYCSDQPTPDAAQSLSESDFDTYSFNLLPFGITCVYGGRFGSEVVAVHHDESGIAWITGAGCLAAALVCELIRASSAKPLRLAG